ncbi:MAG: glycoside hydrolase family 3 C-terminal domain-containing protein, partial [Candidatus Symbiothrix sp.]|nr:glycoside hydrolase family 3 C-terminal domain-containing protein [Candidatus Symbiothrix sp.]
MFAQDVKILDDYKNPNLSSEERAKDLISRLTLEEKTGLMMDESPAIPRLGIKPFYWWSEALHGYANNDKVTVFPEPIGMAASFNDKLVYEVFNATSDEVRAKYNDARQKGQDYRKFLGLSVWTPNINIFRDPRWGRGQETYGEDPYLTSRMGVAVINGLQGPSDSKYKKLLACAKHYAVHSGPEWSRHTLNLNNINPRDLWETYLPAFKAAVLEGDVREVMCAYQRLDDEPCCGSIRLLQTILRDDWGFKYLVVSDCGAISDFWQNHKSSSTPAHAAAKGVLSGTDVECGFNYAYKSIPDAVKQGLLKESDLDIHLLRLLIGRFDLGEMDDDALAPWSKISPSVLNSTEHKKLTLEMSRQTMTLLQNKNNILPLAKAGKKIAVIGPNADDERMLWGNYNGTPNQTISILKGIKSKIAGGKVFYDPACDLTNTMITKSIFNECSIDGKKGLKATYWNNREMEGKPASTQQIVEPLQLTTAGQHEFAPGIKLEGFSGKYETVYKPNEPGEIMFKIESRGYFVLSINNDTIYGKRGSFPQRGNQGIAYKVEQGKEYKIEAVFMQIPNWEASLNFNFGYDKPIDYNELISKLKGIDVVVFAGGISPRLEGEEMPVELPGFKGGDRTNIELPDVQRNYLKALKEAGKQVIFVNCSGSAVAFTPETETCEAILQAWYGGEAGGQAVADVLFGDYNPSGKLPVSFYKNSDNLGDFEDYSMKGRTYRFTDDVLFPFGYGLSYTDFSIQDARLNKTQIKAGETAEITVPVTNTGKRAGVEVVQVYVRKVNDKDGTLKSLKAFQRVEIPAGQSVQATLALTPSAFEFFDENYGEMRVTSG